MTGTCRDCGADERSTISCVRPSRAQDIVRLARIRGYGGRHTPTFCGWNVYRLFAIVSLLHEGVGMTKGELHYWRGSTRLMFLALRAARTGESLDVLFFGDDSAHLFRQVEGQFGPITEDKKIERHSVANHQKRGNIV